MKVSSVNIGKSKTVSWRGKPVKTGIFKYPVNRFIELGVTDVVGDDVIDRKYHGGTYKACYIYSADHYPEWKTKYPELDWDYGMFGENITVEGLNEANVQIGDIYQIGEAKVQVTQPREPCFKLGIRFNSQKVVKDFINLPYPGIYVKVIEEGRVTAGDGFQLFERLHNSVGLLEIWDLIYGKNPNEDLIEFIEDFQHLAPESRETILKRFKRLNQ